MGKRIRLARKKCGLTQPKLGEKLGVTKQAVHQWETGGKRPDQDHLIPLCRLLGVSVTWLLDGKGDPPMPNYQQRIEALEPDKRAIMETVLDGLERKHGQVA